MRINKSPSIVCVWAQNNNSPVVVVDDMRQCEYSCIYYEVFFDTSFNALWTIARTSDTNMEENPVLTIYALICLFIYGGRISSSFARPPVRIVARASALHQRSNDHPRKASCACEAYSLYLTACLRHYVFSFSS